MPISLVCSGCNKSLKLPDKYAGKRIKCPACKASLAVPAATPTGDDQLALQPAEVGQASRAPSGRSKAPRFCPSCGKDVVPGAVICMACGTNVITGEGMPASTTSKERGPGVPVGLIVKGVGVLLLCIVGYYVYAGIFGGSEDPVETAAPPPKPTTTKTPKIKPVTTTPDTPKPVTPKVVEPVKPKGPTDRERFDEALGLLADPLERSNGIGAIRKIGAAALPFIRENLKNEDPSIRSALTRCLRVAPPEEAMKDLVVLIQDDDANVSNAASSVLRAFRGAAIPTCIELTKSEKPSVRAAAVRAMSVNTKSSEVREAVIDLFSDPDANVRYAVVHALANELLTKSSASYLLTALNDTDIDIADAASIGLVKNSRRNLPAVAAAVDAKDSRSAFFCWRVMKGTPSVEKRQAFAAKIAALKGRKTSLTKSLGIRLLTVSDPRGCHKLIAAAANLPKMDRGVSPFLSLKLAEGAATRKLAIGALRDTVDTYIIFPLIMALGDSEPVVVDGALTILAKQRKTPSLTELLRDAAKSRNVQRSIFASATLAKLGEGDAANAVLAALRDTKLPGRIRGVAANVLADLGDKRALEALEIYLAEDKIGAMEKVGYLVAAARLGRAGGFGEVLQLMASSPSTDARIAAARALTGIKDAEVKAALVQSMSDVSAPIGLRLACMKAVAKTLGADAAPQICKLFGGKLTGRMKDGIVATLADMGDGAVDAVIASYRGGDNLVKGQALLAMSHIGSKKCLNLMVSILKDKKSPDALVIHAKNGLAKATGKKYGANVIAWNHHINPSMKLRPGDLKWIRRSVRGPFDSGASAEVPKNWSFGGGGSSSKAWPGEPLVKYAVSRTMQKRYGGSSQNMYNDYRARYMVDRATNKYYKHIKPKKSISHRIGNWPVLGAIYENKEKGTTHLFAVCVAAAANYETTIRLTIRCNTDEWAYNSLIFDQILSTFRFGGD